jgi:gamma-glutamyltranspeptidase/glutathione hydrolase
LCLFVFFVATFKSEARDRIMNVVVKRAAFVFVASFNLAAIVPSSAIADTATGKRWMVATGNALATEAAADVFRGGGNAVDAAVAAALTLGVVDGHNSGIGGGCLILIRTPDGKFIAIDGREMAPAAAHRDMFLRDGKPMPAASQTGPLAVGTPGALTAYQIALERCGTKTLAELLQPGITLAEEGFTICDALADALRDEAPDLRKFEGSRAVLLHADGSPLAAGERLVQRDLAHTYRQIAQHGTDWFYRGPLAQKVGDWMASNGGILTAADFAAYQAKLRNPLVSTYRGYRIVGFPPPSSGGIHVAQILNILEDFDLKQKAGNINPAVTAHIMTEAFKLAFADRAHWLGDADFVDVPHGLISKDYAKELAAKIDPAQATEVPSHGKPPNWQTDLFNRQQNTSLTPDTGHHPKDGHLTPDPPPRHTTHIAAADADGNWVALTATVNTSFGSKVIVPGTGVVLNNEMDDFSIYPGVPNAFGLVGAENNSVAPGKRPLSSMSPTIVLDAAGKPVLTLGAAGGPKIITQVVLTIVRHLDLGQPLPDAVAGPRFHHQWRPDRVMYEKGLAKGHREGLEARGHELEVLDSAGRTQAIAMDRNGQFIGVGDPRGAGKAAGE